MFRFIKPKYNRETLSSIWSESTYDKYKTNQSTWGWGDLPDFNNRGSMFSPPTGPINGKILELGSACGGAYSFMESQGGFTDNTKYTGLEISDKGVQHCKDNYKGPNWIQTDITRHSFNETFDYGFERIAVHHMPDPLSIYNKVLGVINKSFSTNFVSCIDGDTISDLNLSRYRTDSGEHYYFNIINIFEVLEIMLEKGFNKIRIRYVGPHEPVAADPMAHQYFSPDINFKRRLVGRVTLQATKTDGPTDIQLISSLVQGRAMKDFILLFLRPRHSLIKLQHSSAIKERIPRFSERFTNEGVLYSSNSCPSPRKNTGR
jgi:hypothetical protein